jgi:acyl carrier protein
MSAHSASSRPSSADVLTELAEVIGLVTGHDARDIELQRHFVDDLRIDSLSMVEILEGASVRLGVRIDDEAAKDFVRVGDLVDYLDARLAARR